MGEAADLAVNRGVMLEIEEGEGMGHPGRGRDAEMFQERVADEMRRPVRHCADADIDTGLAEIDRPQLRVAVGDVQQRHIAEGRRVVERFGGLFRAGGIERQRETRRACCG